MLVHNQRPTCPRCSQSFSKKSALVRHSKRCLRGIRTPTRKRSCQQCSEAKVRCDLERPECGRCRVRSLVCAFPPARGDEDRMTSLMRKRDNLATSLEGMDGRENESSATAALQSSDSDGDFSAASRDPWPAQTSSSSSSVPVTTSMGNARVSPSCPAATNKAAERVWPSELPPMIILCSERRKTLLGPSPSTPSSEAVARHTVHFVTRALKAWPTMMAMHYTSHLPPMIHPLQLDSGMPQALANCYALTKMWYNHAEGSRELIRNTISQEVRRLFREYRSYGESDLLAATQSILILLIILLFGMGKTEEEMYSAEAHLLTQAWDIKRALAATGLFISEESTQGIPAWKLWAEINAKRRTVHALHHVEWAWSILRGYPLLTCFELGLVPAPTAGYLWREADEGKWRKSYQEWLRTWSDGTFKIGELLHIEAGKALDKRSEMWLAEADEFGMMLMAEINATDSQPA